MNADGRRWMGWGVMEAWAGEHRQIALSGVDGLILLAVVQPR